MHSENNDKIALFIKFDMNKLLNFLNKASGIDVQALETEKQKLEQLAVTLKQKYSDCKQNLLSAEQELEQKKQETEHLQELLKQRAQELESLSGRVAESNEKFELLQKQSQEQQQNLEANKNLYEQLLAEKNELNDRCADLQQKHAELQQLLASKEQELNRFQADRAESEQQLKEAAEQERKELQEAINRIQEQLQEFETQKNGLGIRLAEEQEKLTRQTENAAALERQIEELKTTLQNREEQNGVLCAANADLEAQVRNLQQDLEVSREEIKKLSDKQGELEQLKSQYESVLKQQQDVDDRLREELQAAEQEKTRTVASLEQIQLENNVLRQRITDFKNQAEEQNEMCSQMKLELENKNAEYAELQVRYKNQTEQVEQLRRDADELRKTNGNLELNTRELEQQAAEQGRQTEKWAELENQLASVRSENVAFRDKFAAMETERIKLLKQLEQLQQYCEDLEKQTTKANFQYADGVYFMPYGHEVKAETTGDFIFGSYVANVDKQELFPFALVPTKGTKVVKPVEHQDATPTFWGKTLHDALLPIVQIDRDIKLNIQASIPVPNRNYGVHPDLLLNWPAKNICLAVHIDELYEFGTKKPLHYKDSVDMIIDRLYTDCGWMVMRFSEDQVLGGLKQVVAYIFSKLYELTGDGRFRLKASEQLKTAKWTREDALHAANRRCRENLMDRRIYLNLIEYNKAFATFSGELPDVDVLPSLTDILNALSKRPAGVQALRLTVQPYYSQLLLDPERIQFDGSNLVGYDRITEKECKTSILQVAKLEYVEQLYKSRVYTFDAHEPTDLDTLQSVLAEAICNYNPVQVHYYNGQGANRTNLYWTAFKPQTGSQVTLPYAHLFQTLLDDAVEPELLVTMSSQHNRAVQFDIRQIRQIQVFDAFVTAGEGIDALMTGVYVAELKAQLELADLLYQNIPGNFKKLPFVVANYAHLCVMKGEIKKAADLYLSIPEDEEIGEGKTWQELNKADFQDLIRHDADPKNFIKVAEILAEHNWVF